GELAKALEEAVLQVARALALAIVEDGEGATKLLEIQVTGGATEGAAREVGRAIARSALVKTAVYGADPNWGRVLAAAGAAGVAVRRVVRRVLRRVAGFGLALDVSAGAWVGVCAGCCATIAAGKPARATSASVRIVFRISVPPQYGDRGPPRTASSLRPGV